MNLQQAGLSCVLTFSSMIAQTASCLLPNPNISSKYSSEPRTQTHKITDSNLSITVHAVMWCLPKTNTEFRFRFQSRLKDCGFRTSSPIPFHGVCRIKNWISMLTHTQWTIMSPISAVPCVSRIESPNPIPIPIPTHQQRISNMFSCILSHGVHRISIPDQIADSNSESTTESSTINQGF